MSNNININYNNFNYHQEQEQEQELYHYTSSPPVYANTLTPYKEIYTNTNTNNRNLVIEKKYRFVKDVNKPFTYYSVPVVNDDNDDGVEYSDPRDCNFYHSRPKPSFDDDGCVKLYFCGLFGCCLLCSFACKHV